MKINEVVSPSLFKNLAILVGFFLIYSVWQAVSSKVNEMQYLEVLGEYFDSGDRAERVDLKSLPIVVSESAVAVAGTVTADDQLIEEAFRPPVVEVEEVEEEVVVKVSAVQQVFGMYRPNVSAISGKGAVINGTFWNVGERIVSMPYFIDGARYFPVLRGVSRNQAVLGLGDEKMTLPFERF